MTTSSSSTNSSSSFFSFSSTSSSSSKPHPRRTQGSPPPFSFLQLRLLPLHLLLLLLLYTGVASGDPPIRTRFSGTIGNVTVTVGRDASLSCTVEDLGEHKVGWIHLKRQMIVAVHTRLIARISRYSVTHDSHKTWTLHITGVTEEDSGYYMCQINTDPAISQVGLLQVVVPPTIVDEASSSSEIQVREKANVTLRCAARGVPEPRIMWKREDGAMIVTNTRNPEAVHNGPTLSLRQVSRTHMGAYLCIASNGVPPSVSKRITLDVEFPPQIHVPNQLVGVPTGDNVTIECFVEAFPKAISYWVGKGMMILNSEKYRSETFETLYSIHMKLTIYNFSRDDNTTYQCVAKNSLGETEGDIKLNEIYIPPKAKEIRSGNSKNEDLSEQSPRKDKEDDNNSHNHNHHLLHNHDNNDKQQVDDSYDRSPPVPQSAHPNSHDVVMPEMTHEGISSSGTPAAAAPRHLSLLLFPLLLAGLHHFLLLRRHTLVDK
ncbi:lachesin-like isoform X2 [Portunus trituberculatus]|uniref:lachesin-like isoform X2 n=1 Tax=Portunus trituberculatus TaxID=210409 RepID=UPI001E1D16AC|nr:lachesin-like isoform X2 [Portunus trituberculatus]